MNTDHVQHLSFVELRDANNRRCEIWGEKSVEFSAIELGGETGEFLNEIKKLSRFQSGMAGGKNDPEAVADELADVVICADLCGRKLGIDLDAAVRRKFNKTSDKHGFEIKL